MLKNSSKMYCQNNEKEIKRINKKNKIKKRVQINSQAENYEKQ